MTTPTQPDPLELLLREASDPTLPADFESKLMQGLHRLQDRSHPDDAALDELLLHASDPEPPPRLLRSVLDARFLSKRPALPYRRRRVGLFLHKYAASFLRKCAGAACLFIGTTLVCMMHERMEDSAPLADVMAGAFAQQVFPPADLSTNLRAISDSLGSEVSGGEDILLDRAFGEIQDGELLAAICAVSACGELPPPAPKAEEP